MTVPARKVKDMSPDGRKAREHAMKSKRALSKAIALMPEMTPGEQQMLLEQIEEIKMEAHGAL